MYRSPLNLTVKTALKSVDFSRSYRQNKLAPFYGSRCTVATALRRTRRNHSHRNIQQVSHLGISPRMAFQVYASGRP